MDKFFRSQFPKHPAFVGAITNGCNSLEFTLSSKGTFTPDQMKYLLGNQYGTIIIGGRVRYADSAGRNHWSTGCFVRF